MAEGRNTFLSQEFEGSSRASRIFSYAEQLVATQQALFAKKKIDRTYVDIFTFQPLLDLYKSMCEYIDKNGEVTPAVAISKKAGEWWGWGGCSSSLSSSQELARSSNEFKKDNASKLLSYFGVPTNQKLAMLIKDKIEKNLKLTNREIDIFFQPSPSQYPPSAFVIYATVIELNTIFKDMPAEVVIPGISYFMQGSQVRKALETMLVIYEEKGKTCGHSESLFCEENIKIVFENKL